MINANIHSYGVIGVSVSKVFEKYGYVILLFVVAFICMLFFVETLEKGDHGSSSETAVLWKAADESGQW
jgi:hypothetical protein